MFTAYACSLHMHVVHYMHIIKTHVIADIYMAVGAISFEVPQCVCEIFHCMAGTVQKQ